MDFSFENAIKSIYRLFFVVYDFVYWHFEFCEIHGNLMHSHLVRRQKTFLKKFIAAFVHMRQVMDRSMVIRCFDHDQISTLFRDDRVLADHLRVDYALEHMKACRYFTNLLNRIYIIPQMKFIGIFFCQ